VHRDHQAIKTENKDLVRSVSAIQAAETFWGDLLVQAMVLAGTEAILNTEQWIRREPLISRIPKAPFWTLVGLCIGYVVLIFWIVVTALIYVNSDSENVVKTKMRLNVEAIASIAYEQTKRSLPAADVSELFEENDVGGQTKRIVFFGEISWVEWLCGLYPRLSTSCHRNALALSALALWAGWLFGGQGFGGERYTLTGGRGVFAWGGQLDISGQMIFSWLNLCTGWCSGP
jgi:hypothetical protein